MEENIPYEGMYGDNISILNGGFT